MKKRLDRGGEREGAGWDQGPPSLLPPSLEEPTSKASSDCCQLSTAACGGKPLLALGGLAAGPERAAAPEDPRAMVEAQ